MGSEWRGRALNGGLAGYAVHDITKEVIETRLWKELA
jgi:hypothetical protein